MAVLGCPIGQQSMWIECDDLSLPEESLHVPFLVLAHHAFKIFSMRSMEGIGVRISYNHEDQKAHCKHYETTHTHFSVANSNVVEY